MTNDWTQKINQHEDIVITFNQMSGRKSIRAMVKLSAEDLPLPLEPLHLFGDGKAYLIELIEDKQKATFTNKQLVIPHMTDKRISQAVKKGEELAIHFTTHD